MNRLDPLPAGSVPELNDLFEQFRKSGHYVPNSLLILQRKPKIARRCVHWAVRYSIRKAR